MLNRVIIILNVFFCSQLVGATNYYVNDALTGDDIYCVSAGAPYNATTNDGQSNDEPLETLTDIWTTYGPSGTNVITSGDVIYVDAGSYFVTDEDLTLSVSGVSIIGAGYDYTVFDHNFSGGDFDKWGTITGDNFNLSGIYITGYDNSSGATALHISGATNVTITNVMVNENDPSGGSSAILVNGGSSVTFSGGGSSCNPGHLSVAGGGVNIEGNGNTVSFDDYIISNNEKDLQGGAGLYISGNSTTSVTITNSTFSGNVTNGDGGGAILIFDGATLNITGSCFNNNEASKTSSVNYGGAIFVGEGSDVVISDCLFSGNFASPSGNGGAIAINSTFGSNGGTPTVTLTDCGFSSNAATDGADVYTRGSNGGIITATECTWSATSDDGHVDAGSITLANSGSPNETGVSFTNVTLASNTPSTSCPSVTAPCFSVLPVELIDFGGECLNSQFHFNWRTASELNNDYFTIEKREDENSWSKVKVIDGAGTTQLIQEYSTVVNVRGSNYYRLKQTDYDGETHVHKTIFVQSCVDKDQLEQPYFNQAGNIVIPYFIKKSSLFSIRLVNGFGNLIMDEGKTLDANENTLTLNMPKGISSGIYYLDLSSDNQNYTFKLCVLK